MCAEVGVVVGAVHIISGLQSVSVLAQDEAVCDTHTAPSVGKVVHLVLCGSTLTSGRVTESDSCD